MHGPSGAGAGPPTAKVAAVIPPSRSATADARPRARQPRPATRLRRASAAAALTVAVVGALYAIARETALFAVDSVEVVGGSQDVAAKVREALSRYEGTSLVKLDPDRVRADVERLSVVVSAKVDRAFPDTLRVSVRPERPVAVLRHGQAAWLVSSRGRVIREIEPGELTRLPRVWLTGAQHSLVPGAYVLDDEGGAAIRAIARIPEGFPARIEAATGTVDDLRLTIGGNTELRLGEAADIRLKLEVAALVLRHLSAAERKQLLYLDVSVPTRVVARENFQVGS